MRINCIYIVVALFFTLLSGCEKVDMPVSPVDSVIEPYKKYLNDVLPDSLLPVIRDINQQATEKNDLEEMTTSTNILVNRYMLNGEYEEGFTCANDFLQHIVQKGDSSAIVQAYYNIGRLHYGLGLADISLDYFLKAAQYPMTDKEKCRIYYAIGETSRSSGTVAGINSEEYYKMSEEIAYQLNDSGAIASALFGLSQIYYSGFDAYKEKDLPENGRRDSLLYSTDLLKKGMQYKSSDYILHCALGLNYCALREIEKAKPHIEAAVAQCKEIPDLIPLGLNVLSAYYICAGHYDEAIANSKEAYQYAKEWNKKGDMRNTTNLLYYAYKYKGDARQALEALEREQELGEDIKSEERSLQVISRQIEHNTRLKEEELNLARINEASYRKINLILLTACIIFIILLVLIIIQQAKNKHAYRELVRKSREWASNDPLIRKEETTDKESAENGDSLLMETIHHRIIQDQLYKDSTITLGSLADILHVRRTFLSQIINRSTGNNFNTFINEYRVKEAILLMESEKNKATLTPPLSMEDIAFDTGFNDRISFYRAFKKVTGLSPTDFRKNI